MTSSSLLKLIVSYEISLYELVPPLCLKGMLYSVALAT